MTAQELHIPAHEYRYIKVRFAPQARPADVTDGVNRLLFTKRGVVLGRPWKTSKPIRKLHVVWSHRMSCVYDIRIVMLIDST